MRELSFLTISEAEGKIYNYVGSRNNGKQNHFNQNFSLFSVVEFFDEAIVEVKKV